eukprot:jgi/Tetstr1/458240/TSEL_044728.t1
MELRTPADIPLSSRESHHIGNCLVTTVHLTDGGLVDDDGRAMFGARRGGEGGRRRGRRRAEGCAEDAAGAGADGAPAGGADEELLLRMRLMGLPTGFASHKKAARGARSRRGAEVLLGSASEDEDMLAPEAQEGELMEGEEEEEEGEGEEEDVGIAEAEPRAEEEGEGVQGEGQGQHAGGVWQQAFDPAYQCYYYYREATQETQWEPPPAGFLPAPHIWSAEAHAGAAQEGADAEGGAAVDATAGGNPPAGAHHAVAEGGHEESVGGLIEGLHEGPLLSDEQLREEEAAAAVPLAAALVAAEAAAAAAADSVLTATAEGAGEAAAVRQLEGEAPPLGEGARAEASGSGGGSESVLALHKYWRQRYSLFSRFDRGIQMDEEAWFSVTPEMVARQQARRCCCAVAVDAFAGAGGNSIALARECGHVIAIDRSEARLRLAKANAGVYGAAGDIDFLIGDFFRLAPHLRADVVFLSPPWGGPSYLRAGVFDTAADLGGMGMGLPQLLGAARQSIAPTGSGSGGSCGGGGGSSRPGGSGVACFLPRNVSLAQLSETAGEEALLVERHVLNGHLKGVTAYYGGIGAAPGLPLNHTASPR